MCGIVGIVSTRKDGLTKDQYHAFAWAWSKAEERGNHACGYVISANGRFNFWKAPITPTEGAYKMLGDYRHRPGMRFMIGHTRWATAGGPENNINNHPIVVGYKKELLGIHNGVIGNKDELMSKMKWEPAREVDTEIAFRLINHFGVESLKPFGMLRGSWNLAYCTRKHSNRVYLVRHDNPLSFVMGKDYVAFSSMPGYWGYEKLGKGKTLEARNNTRYIISGKGIVKEDSFTPKDDITWWGKIRVDMPRKDYPSYSQLQGMTEKEWDDSLRQPGYGYGYYMDPETGTLERESNRRIWPD